MFRQITRILHALVASRPVAKNLRLLSADNVVVGPHPGSLTAEVNLGRRSVFERRFVDVALPDELVLRRTINLPKLSKHRLRRAARLDLERIAPFNTSEVAYVVRQQTVSRGLVETEQVIVKHRTLDELRTQIEDTGRSVHRFWVKCAGVDTVIIDDVTRSFPARRWIQSANLVVLAGLLIVAGTSWYAPVQEALIRLGEARARQAELLTMTADARGRLEDLRGAAEQEADLNAIVLERDLPLNLLATATELLPDEIWLTEVEIRNRQISLAGQSAIPIASEILRINEQNEDVMLSLTGPIAQMPDGEMRFQLSMRTLMDRRQ